MSDFEGLLSSDESEQLNYDNESDDSSSEEEVLPVYSESESDADDNDSRDEANISESDIDHEDDDDLPDPKAWGKNKRSYYNGDNINDKANKITNEEDEEAIKLEEEDAMVRQKQLVAKIDEADLAFDLLSDVMIGNEKDDETVFDEQNEKVQIDLSKMNDLEKSELIKKESPELLTYIEDFKVLMACVQNELLPVIKVLKKKKSRQLGAGQFIQLYNQLLLNYCTNIVFYVLLRSRKTDVKFHPSLQWLEKYKVLVEEAKPTYEEVFKPQIKLIMKDDFKSLSRINRKRKWNDTANKPESKVTTHVSNEQSLEHAMADEDDVDSSGDVDMMEDGLEDANEIDSKRPITYQIAKNKGLTPHRKKELRNPRVKHRMKYRKAKIRRKGQVREVRKEVRKYDGEISGIKPNVVKSIKFKV